MTWKGARKQRIELVGKLPESYKTPQYLHCQLGELQNLN